MSEYTIRQLRKEDWAIYKEIRLESLQKEPRSFGASYADESLRTDSEWQQRLEKPNDAFFGVFDGSVCVALAGVVEKKDDPEAAVLIAHYVREPYRGQGLSNLFYKASIEWTYQQKRFKRIIVCHRAWNVASKAAIQKHGFRYTHSESKTWPDGVAEENVFYELLL